jgi:hypothetical protein
MAGAELQRDRLARAGVISLVVAVGVGVIGCQVQRSMPGTA